MLGLRRMAGAAVAAREHRVHGFDQVRRGLDHVLSRSNTGQSLFDYSVMNGYSGRFHEVPKVPSKYQAVPSEKRPFMDIEGQKRAAAARALEFVRPGMRLGLGSGSTAKHFVELLAERVRGGLDVIAVPTSEATRADAERLGVPLTSLDETPSRHDRGQHRRYRPGPDPHQGRGRRTAERSWRQRPAAWS
jgi:hypothetical protein